MRLFAPDDVAAVSASPLREFGALRRREVWLTLATGAIGFGGLSPSTPTCNRHRYNPVDAADGCGRGAQALAAALNHSAFNVANAIGPLLGGLAIGAGLGWTSTGWVGSALALLGLGAWDVAA